MFRRRSKPQPPTKEDVAKRKKRIDEISAEVERGNFERAIELAVRCVENYKGKDPFGDAFCSYLVGHSLVCKHLSNASPPNYLETKISFADYNKAKTYLNRSLEIYDFFARNKRFERNRRLKSATVLIDMVLLESIARKWDKAIKACTRSLDIYKKYEFRKGMQLATQMMLNLRLKKIFFDIKQFAGL